MDSKQRARLRASANGIETVLQIGKDGIGENLIRQADMTLEARELIKGRVLDGCIDYTARTAAEALAEATNSEVIQVIGSKFVLYRKRREEGKEAEKARPRDKERHAHGGARRPHDNARRQVDTARRPDGDKRRQDDKRRPYGDEYRQSGKRHPYGDERRQSDKRRPVNGGGQGKRVGGAAQYGKRPESGGKRPDFRTGKRPASGGHPRKDAPAHTVARNPHKDGAPRIGARNPRQDGGRNPHTSGVPRNAARNPRNGGGNRK